MATAAIAAAFYTLQTEWANSLYYDVG